MEGPRIVVMGSVDQQLRLAGATPVHATSTDRRVAELIELGGVHGLLLTGGGDVSPDLYGQKRSRHVYGLWPQRDLAEFEALAAADKAGIPIMGICRGAQMMNVAFGGTLHQHLPTVPGAHKFHNGHDHRVKTAKGSRLRRAFGADERWVVSLHHQAVDDVAPGFVATAWGLDGTVEAVESVEGWKVGVQFHPEIDHTPHSQRLFNAFVRAAAKAAGLAAFRTPSYRLTKNDSAYRGGGGDGYWSGKAANARAAQLAVVEKTPSIGVPRKERVAKGETVLSRWRCFRCAIPDFDVRADYIDHMLFIHDVDVLSKEGATR